jgi:hypothetical protein
MKLTQFTFLSLAFVLSGTAFGQSNLPECQGSDVSRWSNCTGEETHSGRHQYKGEFLNGKSHGFGVMNVLHPDFKGHKYVGEFKDGKYNGQGTYTDANGNKYVGEYKDGKYNGQGTYTYANGDKYVEVKNSDSPFTFDVGSRYWYSTTNIKTEGLNNGASYGNPSFVIDWSNMTGSNLELFGKMMHSESEYFVKGYVGTNLGNGDSGKMSDVDYASGQTTTSVLNTDAKQLSVSYGVLDFGKDFKLSNTSISPFLGYFYWKQKSQSYGGTIGAITSGDYTIYNVLGLTVGQVLLNSVNVITYETTVNAPRFGFQLNQPVSEKFTVDFELAYMPFANIKLNDTHNAAPNHYVTNGSPNVVSSGQGWGYGSDIYLKYKVTENTKIGLGFRYQYFELKNQSLSVNLVYNGWNTDATLQKLILEKYGLMLSGEYRF